MENILQVWLYFTCKQTPKNGKTFFEKYFTKKKKKQSIKVKKKNSFFLQNLKEFFKTRCECFAHNYL